MLVDQVPEAQRLRPDVAVVSVGANDATHGTWLRRFEADLDAVVEAFGEAERTSCSRASATSATSPARTC